MDNAIDTFGTLSAYAPAPVRPALALTPAHLCGSAHGMHLASLGMGMSAPLLHWACAHERCALQAPAPEAESRKDTSLAGSIDEFAPKCEV